MGTPLHQLSPKIQTLVANAIAPAKVPAGFKPVAGAQPEVRFGFIPTPVKKRLRQKQGDGMNRTERAFFQHLKIAQPEDVHHAQAFSLRLANGANYRPDFISTHVVQPRSAETPAVVRVSAWETKGFKREASAVRIKIAAALYPWITFHLVTKRKLGGWDIEIVLP